MLQPRTLKQGQKRCRDGDSYQVVKTIKEKSHGNMAFSFIHKLTNKASFL